LVSGESEKKGLVSARLRFLGLVLGGMVNGRSVDPVSYSRERMGFLVIYFGYPELWCPTVSMLAIATLTYTSSGGQSDRCHVLLKLLPSPMSHRVQI
jgi:hypothetical protein